MDVPWYLKDYYVQDDSSVFFKSADSQNQHTQDWNFSIFLELFESALLRLSTPAFTIHKKVSCRVWFRSIWSQHHNSQQKARDFPSSLPLEPYIQAFLKSHSHYLTPICEIFQNRKAGHIHPCQSTGFQAWCPYGGSLVHGCIQVLRWCRQRWTEAAFH